MKNYKFAWCTVGFTMCLPLFIQHDIGFWLGAGFMLSTVVFFCSLVANNMSEAIANGARPEAYRNISCDSGPIDRWDVTSTWHSCDD